MQLDETHDPKRTSWIDSANDPGTDFPIQNLPFGVFRRRGSKEAPRAAVAIGDWVLELGAAGALAGFKGEAAEAAEAGRAPTLNALAALGRQYWHPLRVALSRALAANAPANVKKALEGCLVPMKEAELLLPVEIPDYTDFYTSLFHATNIGKLFRPDEPLLPNFKWVPIGYHGRASSVVVSGTGIVRPRGQAKAPDAPAPAFGPCKRLDYEVELGFVCGPGNPLGTPVRIANALERVFGVVLLNDWSARDIQAWEYQPLGPFLGKSFATTVSPWIVTLEALEPYRVHAFRRPPSDPAPLPYLTDPDDRDEGGLSIELEMYLRTEQMRASNMPPVRLSLSNYRDAYWTLAQLVTHHTSNGCNLRTGDLLGSGTLSGPAPESAGAMIELTQGGKHSIKLPGGEQRTFVEDGDELTMRGRCSRDGFATIGFGEAAGFVLPSLK
jgi:fumarylacetoacetase